MSDTDKNEFWKVDFSNKAGKQVDKLPPNMRAAVYLLRHALEEFGPEQTGWRNYSLIVGGNDVHHCHLNNSRPRYVVVWKVLDREKRIIEVRYAGPHGSAVYSRFK
ncbi:MAG: cytotoxic translational repressor of toxin-antitoxin stability system [Desulfovibrio sp.]|jgi:mRNA-degrading endonuclease RelE of RelBE toxin-antitoxin system|nr:cytotoxic translational repressor of toxin-antitoxin stability system [Desulfovibrio sp.]